MLRLFGKAGCAVVIYKFKSKASGDVIMLGPNGDELLRHIGREPAAKGIIEIDAMPAAISSLEAAVLADEAHAKTPESAEEPRIRLRARVWPMVDMLKRALSERQPIVWGV